MKMNICGRLGPIVTAIVALLVQDLVAAESNLIVPADSLPETTPWDLEELSNPPEFEWGEGDEIRSLYYKSEPYQGKTTRVFAYYATPGSLSGDPAKDNNLPAIVLVHGGGGTAFPSWTKLWASRGYAAIAMDLGGRGPNKAVSLTDGGPGQGDEVKFGAIDQPITNQWPYHAVANVIRAHSLIRSFKEVDAEKTAITGISWGGYLTCIVAGLDHRFKAAVPIYGCGFLHDNSVWLNQFRQMTPENKSKWVQLWDPSQYVGSASMPMLLINGGNDFAYPPDSHAKTYALIRSPKNIRIVPDLPHGHIFGRPKAVEVFIKHHLASGIPLARISALETGNKKVTAHVDANMKLVRAEIHYTMDRLPGDPGTRQWVTKAATIARNQITADLPPENITIWFLTVEDERNTIVSSKLVFPMGMDRPK
jgi:cephalosporin-C deacetylase-like acetyl esterase